jgi:hypothetical protein
MGLQCKLTEEFFQQRLVLALQYYWKRIKYQYSYIVLLPFCFVPPVLVGKALPLTPAAAAADEHVLAVDLIPVLAEFRRYPATGSTWLQNTEGLILPLYCLPIFVA